MGEINFRGKYNIIPPIILPFKFVDMRDNLHILFKFNYSNLYMSFLDTMYVLADRKSENGFGVDIINELYGIKQNIGIDMVGEISALKDDKDISLLYSIQTVKVPDEVSLLSLIDAQKNVKHTSFDKYDIVGYRNSKYNGALNKYDVTGYRDDGYIGFGDWVDLSYAQQLNEGSIQHIHAFDRSDVYSAVVTEIFENDYLFNRLNEYLGSMSDNNIVVYDSAMMERYTIMSGVLDALIIDALKVKYNATVLNDILLAKWIDFNTKLPVREAMILKRNILDFAGDSEDDYTFAQRVSEYLGHYIEELKHGTRKQINDAGTIVYSMESGGRKFDIETLFSTGFLVGAGRPEKLAESFLEYKEIVESIVDRVIKYYGIEHVRDLIIAKTRESNRIGVTDNVWLVDRGHDRDPVPLPETIKAELDSRKDALIRVDVRMYEKILKGLGFIMDVYVPGKMMEKPTEVLKQVIGEEYHLSITDYVEFIAELYCDAMYFFTDEVNKNYFGLQLFNNTDDNTQKVHPKGKWADRWDLEYDNPLTPNKLIKADLYEYPGDLDLVVDPVTGDILVPIKEISLEEPNKYRIPPVYNPFPEEWSNVGKPEGYPVDGFFILRDMILFLINLWEFYYYKLVGMDAKQAFNLILGDIYEWIMKYASDRDDYKQVFRLMLAYAQQITDEYCPTWIKQYWLDKNVFYRNFTADDFIYLRYIDFLAYNGHMFTSTNATADEVADAEMLFKVKDMTGGTFHWEGGIESPREGPQYEYNLVDVITRASGHYGENDEETVSFDLPDGGEVFIYRELDEDCDPASWDDEEIHDDFETPYTENEYHYNGFAHFISDAPSDEWGVVTCQTDIEEEVQHGEIIDGDVYPDDEVEFSFRHDFGVDAEMKYDLMIHSQPTEEPLNMNLKLFSVDRSISNSYVEPKIELSGSGGHGSGDNYYMDNGSMYLEYPPMQGDGSSVAVNINIDSLTKVTTGGGTETKDVTADRSYQNGGWTSIYTKIEEKSNTETKEVWKTIPTSDDWSKYGTESHGRSLNVYKKAFSPDPLLGLARDMENLVFQMNCSTKITVAYKTSIISKEWYFTYEDRNWTSGITNIVFMPTYRGVDGDQIAYFYKISKFEVLTEETASTGTSYYYATDQQCLSVKLQHEGCVKIKFNVRGVGGSNLYVSIDGGKESKIKTNINGSESYVSYTTPYLGAGSHKICYYLTSHTQNTIDVQGEVSQILEKVPKSVSETTPASVVDIYVNDKLYKTLNTTGIHRVELPIMPGGTIIKIRCSGSKNVYISPAGDNGYAVAGSYNTGGGYIETPPSAGDSDDVIPWNPEQPPGGSDENPFIPGGSDGGQLYYHTNYEPLHIDDIDGYFIFIPCHGCPHDVYRYKPRIIGSGIKVFVSMNGGNTWYTYGSGGFYVGGAGNTVSEINGISEDIWSSFAPMGDISFKFVPVSGGVRVDGVYTDYTTLDDISVPNPPPPDYTPPPPDDINPDIPEPPELPPEIEDAVFYVLIDGSIVQTVTGDFDWDHMPWIYIPSGSHRITFRFKRYDPDVQYCAVDDIIIREKANYEPKRCGRGEVRYTVDRYLEDEYGEYLDDSFDVTEYGELYDDDPYHFRLKPGSYALTIENRSKEPVDFYVDRIEVYAREVIPPIEPNGVLEFFIDGEKMGEWSGVGSIVFDQPISYGNHLIEWRFTKHDPAVPEEYFYVDYVVVPMVLYDHTDLTDSCKLNSGNDAIKDLIDLLIAYYRNNFGDVILPPIKTDTVYFKKTVDRYKVHAGETVTYTYTIFNDTNYTAYVHNVYDNKLGKVLGSVSIETGGTYKFTTNNIITETTTNVAVLTYTINGVDYTRSAEATVFVVTNNLVIEKFASALEVAYGKDVEYTYRISNKGNDIIYNVVAVDDKLGQIALVDSLQPGEERVYKKMVKVLQNIHNTVVVTGTDSLGQSLEDTAEADVKVKVSDLLKKYVWILT